MLKINDENDKKEYLVNLYNEIYVKDLALRTGKSRVTIARKISEMKRMHLIRRAGSDKNGHWEIL